MRTCCLKVPMAIAAKAVFTVLILYSFCFIIVSIAKHADFSETFGSVGMLVFEIIIHILVLLFGATAIFIIVKKDARHMHTMSNIYWGMVAVLGLVQMIMLILAGVHNGNTILVCQAENPGVDADQCGHWTQTSMALLGVSFVIWTCLQVYFGFVIQSYAVSVLGRHRYGELRTHAMEDWDAKIELNDGHVSRVGTTRTWNSTV
ncbi:hypothetical protein BGW37DRAFT_486958, partial [Umbelopsis sp. PMI_123]